MPLPVMQIEICEDKTQAQSRLAYFQQIGATIRLPPTQLNSIDWRNSARGTPSADAWGAFNGDVWVVIASK